MAYIPTRSRVECVELARRQSAGEDLGFSSDFVQTWLSALDELEASPPAPEAVTAAAVEPVAVKPVAAPPKLVVVAPVDPEPVVVAPVAVAAAPPTPAPAPVAEPPKATKQVVAAG